MNEAGIRSFYPEISTLRSWHDRIKSIPAPLFPGYIFVYLNGMEEYYAGLAIEGVLQYVRVGKEVARVKDQVIEDLRKIIRQGRDIVATEESFTPGQHGPLNGLNCEVVRMNGKQRLLVRVELLKRNVLVSLPSGSLIASYA